MQLDFDLLSAPKREPATDTPVAAPAKPPAKSPAPEPEEPRILGVGELNRLVRSLLEDRVGAVWVEGEISNLRRQSSGHLYFTLKDDSGQVSCAFFSQSARALKERLEDGQQVRLLGDVSLYEQRGQYQIIVRAVKPAGLGALQAKFEALKRRLDAEGLFAPDRKRPLPAYPAAIGVVTSPSGAALRDFLQILGRRAPGVRVVIAPCRVQGSGAATEIAFAIAELGELSGSGKIALDAIVVTRGGGSIEDLWEFNEEIVARAIVASPLPVISAVGHEIDFTIADFAADLRAPTPSAAAELISADHVAGWNHLRQSSARLGRAARTGLGLLASRIDSLRRAALFREPARALDDARQRVDRAAEAMGDSIHSRLQTMDSALDRARGLLAARGPAHAISMAALRLRTIDQSLHGRARTRLAQASGNLSKTESLLRALNPEATLSRGYTITTDASGRILRSCRESSVGLPIVTRFADGEIRSIVKRQDSVTDGSPDPLPD